MPSKNEFYIASAGAGKTTCIAKYAHEHPKQKILLTTYTQENTSLLTSYLVKLCGFVPQNVTVHSWFSFLLTQCIRPYQSYIYPSHRIEGICFVNCKSTLKISRSMTSQYYFASKGVIYSDKLSEFTCYSNIESKNKVIERLEKLYDVIIIDEAQDLSGWDLDFVSLLLKSSIKVIIYGDPRQRTYSTTPSPKNAAFAKDIRAWFTHLQTKGLGSIILMNYSNRCIQAICDLADLLFPDFPHTESRNITLQTHMGIFLVAEKDIAAYYDEFHPKILVHNITFGRRYPNFPCRNFGEVKGQTYDRVLIVPTGPILSFLKSGTVPESAANKLYVAITRARFSVAFLADCSCSLNCIQRWKPNQT